MIDQQGREAAITRALAAAGVQAPVIYRLFGDKRGLLDAVALHRLQAYVAEKSARPPDPDPIRDLRDGWNMHVAFGLAHPELFAILSGPSPSESTAEAVNAGMDVMRRRIHRVALAGKLRTSEARAASLMQAVATGTVQTLLAQPKARRDPGLADAARDVLMSAIVDTQAVTPVSGVHATAAALRASLEQTSVLTDGEQHLLAELLERIARAPPP